MDKLELIKVLKYAITCITEKDYCKLMALQEHMETLRVESEDKGNLYIAMEIVHHALKEV